MAQIAYDVNRRTANIGARRLYTILERVFETISFDAPELPDKTVTITGPNNAVVNATANVTNGGYQWLTFGGNNTATSGTLTNSTLQLLAP